MYLNGVTYGGSRRLGLMGPAMPASPMHNVAFSRCLTPAANVLATSSVGPLQKWMCMCVCVSTPSVCVAKEKESCASLSTHRYFATSSSVQPAYCERASRVYSTAPPCITNHSSAANRTVCCRAKPAKRSYLIPSRRPVYAQQCRAQQSARR